MLKKILLIAIISAVGYVLLQAYGAYRVYKRSTFKFIDFSDIVSIFDEGDKKITVKINNPTTRKIVVKNLNIVIENSQGSRVGAFQPLDLTIMEGQNNAVLMFSNDTKYLKIGTDYITGAIGGYNLQISGLWLGFIPFKFKVKLSNFL